MTPFLLSPAGKDYIWGGERLKTLFGKVSALSPLAESWECSVHPDGPSQVASGAFAGRSLAEVLAEHPEFLGDSPSAAGGLYILVKLIDAKRDLSVQVHPDDGYAFREEGGQQGKTEVWYVLDAEPGACLVFGLNRAATAEELRLSLENGTFESLLRRVPVHRGDVFYIPSGTIHAIGGGILLAEVQQNSNLTYRLYDYGRLGKDGRPRELHIDKALAVADLSGAQPVRQPLRALRYRPGFVEELLCTGPNFRVSHCRLLAGPPAGDVGGTGDAGGDGFGAVGGGVGADGFGAAGGAAVISVGDAGAASVTDVLLPALPESYRVLLCTDGAGVLSEGASAGSAEPASAAGVPDGAGVLSEGTSAGSAELASAAGVPDDAGVLSEGAVAGTLRFRKGDTVFIPATAGPLALSGRAEFLLIRG